MGDQRQIEVVGIRVDEGRKILLVKPSVAAPAAIGGEAVDKFLLEALQNPRDRLTVLRLEEEIQRFLMESEAQQIEFQAVGSKPATAAFFRLATQRVAQHYGLIAKVVENSNSSKVCVTRSADGTARHGGKRLADISPKVAPPRVAIKQRTTPPPTTPPTPRTSSTATIRNGFRDRSRSNIKVKLIDPRSVEERKEEYSKARARIFQDSGDEDVGGQIEAAKMVNKEPALTTTATGPRIFTTKDDKENVRRLFKEESSGKGKPKPNTPNRIAIIRDREKDRKDPDYDRSYDRYLQRYDRGFVAHPVVPYTTQFDACIQQHPTPPSPSAAVAAAAVPTQPIYSSWMAPPTPPQPGYTTVRGHCRDGGAAFAMDAGTTYSSYGAYPSQDARFFPGGYSSYSFSSSFQAFDSLPQQPHYQMPLLPGYNNVHCPQHY